MDLLRMKMEQQKEIRSSKKNMGYKSNYTGPFYDD